VSTNSSFQALGYGFGGDSNMGGLHLTKEERRKLEWMMEWMRKNPDINNLDNVHDSYLL
jgi:hypothetical protein